MPERKRGSRRTASASQPTGVVSKCTFCYHRISKAPNGTADLSEADPATKEYTPACVRDLSRQRRVTSATSTIRMVTVSKLIADKGGVRLLDQQGNKPQVYYLTGVGGVVPSNRTNKGVA